MSILEPGDVRAILPAEKLTHRVIHLESPTVTLCVKTINEPGLHQWEYYADGLALQRHDLDADPHQGGLLLRIPAPAECDARGPLSPGHRRRVERRDAHDPV